MEAMYTQERLAAITTFVQDARRSADLRAARADVLQRRAVLARLHADAAAERLRIRRASA